LEVVHNGGEIEIAKKKAELIWGTTSIVDHVPDPDPIEPSVGVRDRLEKSKRHLEFDGNSTSADSPSTDDEEDEVVESEEPKKLKRTFINNTLPTDTGEGPAAGLSQVPIVKNVVSKFPAGHGMPSKMEPKGPTSGLACISQGQQPQEHQAKDCHKRTEGPTEGSSSSSEENIGEEEV
jgi:hypothetical protein